MTPPVYPDAPFFSALPRHVWTLIAQGALQRRDAALLGVLLDYKPKRGAVVTPAQATLARRLGCSVDTVQRGLARLAAAGLVLKRRLRDGLGRLRGLAYDLAGVLAHMPPKAAKLRSGDWRAGEGGSPNEEGNSPNEEAGEGGSPKPQNCGPEEDRKNAAQADSPAPACATQSALAAVGVRERVARSLIEKFGEEVCRRQLAALADRRRIRDKAAALVASILEGWAVPQAGDRPAASPPPKPRRPDPPPLCAETPPAPADPLDALTRGEWITLETWARADLCRRLPRLRPLLDRGKCVPIVRARMRSLRAEGPDGA